MAPGSFRVFLDDNLVSAFKAIGLDTNRGDPDGVEGCADMIAPGNADEKVGAEEGNESCKQAKSGQAEFARDVLDVGSVAKSGERRYAKDAVDQGSAAAHSSWNGFFEEAVQKGKDVVWTAKGLKAVSEVRQRFKVWEKIWLLLDAGLQNHEMI